MTHERLTAMPQKGIPGHCHLAQIFGADGNSVACIDSTADPEIASERARRLVACWNACDGLTADQLERCGTLDRANVARNVATQRHIAELTAQRDELLAALKAAVECGMVPTSSASEGGASRHSRQVQVADMIRAAIQKATNKDAAIGAHKEGA